MTYPGEQFYPKGTRWDDGIERGTLPDLLAKAAREFGSRPAIEFRDRAISYDELERLADVAASAFLRAGGCQRIKEGLELAVRTVRELHFILGAHGAEWAVAGRSILIGVQIDCSARGDGGIGGVGRVDADHISVAERRIVEESAVDLIACDRVCGCHDHVGGRPIPELAVERDQASNRRCHIGLFLN
jgi:hypothetical protein